MNFTNALEYVRAGGIVSYNIGYEYYEVTNETEMGDCRNITFNEPLTFQDIRDMKRATFNDRLVHCEYGDWFFDSGEEIYLECETNDILNINNWRRV